jgi:hypothetical protein
MTKPKSYHESFARFFEQPTRDGFRELMRANPGELRSCDFKAEWPAYPGFAKHLLGLANSGGGCLVVGVAEVEDGTLESKGLESLKDKANITNGIKHYLPSYLLGMVDVVDYSFDASEYPVLVGKRFQVVFVEDDPTHLPFVAEKNGASIRRAAVYARHEGMTEEAGNDELQAMINRRLATGHSTQREIDLKTHLDQLQVLYSALSGKHLNLGAVMSKMAVAGLSVPNPKYPSEDFEAFVLRMIEEKKRRIAEELDVLRPSD